MALILYKNNIQQVTKHYKILQNMALILYKNNIQQAKGKEPCFMCE